MSTFVTGIVIITILLLFAFIAIFVDYSISYFGKLLKLNTKIENERPTEIPVNNDESIDKHKQIHSRISWQY